MNGRQPAPAANEVSFLAWKAVYNGTITRPHTLDNCDWHSVIQRPHEAISVSEVPAAGFVRA